MAPKRSGSPMQQGSSKKVKTHISVKEFETDLQAAVNKVLPSPQLVFSEALLVILNWTKCSFDDENAIGDLINTFKDVYNIPHQRIMLDSDKNWKDVRADLKKKMAAIDAQTVPDAGDDSCKLVIIYYSGHAQRQVSEKDVWIYGAHHPDGKRKAPFLLWKEVSSMMTELRGARRVVHIMDCCNAGMAALDTDIATMCACSWESIASQDWNTSFTTMLTEEIRAGKGATISPADLIGDVLRHSNDAHEGSQPCMRHPKNENAPAIMFHKMPDKNVTSPPTAPAQAPKKRPLVIVNVRMDKDMERSDLVAFQKWLTTDIPDGIGTIDIAAKWKTRSTALQFIMPAAVWFALPGNDSEVYHYQGLYLGEYECFPLQKLRSLAATPSLLKKENIGLGERSPSRRNIEAGSSYKTE